MVGCQLSISSHIPKKLMRPENALVNASTFSRVRRWKLFNYTTLQTCNFDLLLSYVECNLILITYRCARNAATTFHFSAGEFLANTTCWCITRAAPISPASSTGDSTNQPQMLVTKLVLLEKLLVEWNTVQTSVIAVFVLLYACFTCPTAR